MIVVVVVVSVFGRRVERRPGSVVDIEFRVSLV